MVEGKSNGGRLFGRSAHPRIAYPRPVGIRHGIGLEDDLGARFGWPLDGARKSPAAPPAGLAAGFFTLRRCDSDESLWRTGEMQLSSHRSPAEGGDRPRQPCRGG